MLSQRAIRSSTKKLIEKSTGYLHFDCDKDLVCRSVSNYSTFLPSNNAKIMLGSHLFSDVGAGKYVSGANKNILS